MGDLLRSGCRVDYLSKVNTPFPPKLALFRRNAVGHSAISDQLKAVKDKGVLAEG
jgi:hypothetical protein